MKKMRQQLVLMPVISLLVACGSQTGNGKADADKAITDSTPTTPAEIQPGKLGEPFSKTVRYDNFEITVSSDNTALDNKFKIKTTGFRNVNLNDEMPLAGKVTDVLIDDIDADNAPEVFIITRPDKGGLATVYGYSANKDLSMSMINIPDFKDEAKAGVAMVEGDEYMPVENSLVVRFPVFENGSKTSKIRQMQYKLRPGEAMKQLVIDRTVDY